MMRETGNSELETATPNRAVSKASPIKYQSLNIRLPVSRFISSMWRLQNFTSIVFH